MEKLEYTCTRSPGPDSWSEDVNIFCCGLHIRGGSMMISEGVRLEMIQQNAGKVMPLSCCGQITLSNIGENCPLAIPI